MPNLCIQQRRQDRKTITYHISQANRNILVAERQDQDEENVISPTSSLKASRDIPYTTHINTHACRHCTQRPNSTSRTIPIPALTQPLGLAHSMRSSSHETFLSYRACGRICSLQKFGGTPQSPLEQLVPGTMGHDADHIMYVPICNTNNN